jgi:hypothetical protein
MKKIIIFITLCVFMQLSVFSQSKSIYITVKLQYLHSNKYLDQNCDIILMDNNKERVLELNKTYNVEISENNSYFSLNYKKYSIFIDSIGKYIYEGADSLYIYCYINKKNSNNDVGIVYLLVETFTSAWNNKFLDDDPHWVYLTPGKYESIYIPKWRRIIKRIFTRN